MTDLVIRAVLEIADFMIAQKRVDEAVDKAAAAFVRMGGAQDKAAAAAAAYGARLLESSKKLMGLVRAHDPVSAAMAKLTTEQQRLVRGWENGAIQMDVYQRVSQSISRQLARQQHEMDGTAARFRTLGDAVAVAAREQQRMEASAQQLKDAINPLAAAQRAYEAELAKTLSLQKAGLITDAERVARNAQLSASFSQTAEAINRHAVRAAGGVAVTAGQMGMLGQQVQDVVVSLAGGQNPFLVILQQAPQAAYAVGGFAELWGVVKKQVASAAAALMTVRGALIASGIGAVAVGLGVLVDLYIQGTRSSANFKKQMDEANKSLDQQIDNINGVAKAYAEMDAIRRRAFEARLIERQSEALKEQQNAVDALASSLKNAVASELLSVPVDPMSGLILDMDRAREASRVLDELEAARKNGLPALEQSIALNEAYLKSLGALGPTYDILRGRVADVIDQHKRLAAEMRFVSGVATDADRALLGLIPTAYELAASFAKSTAEFNEWIATNGAGEEALARYKATLDGVITADEQRAIAQGAVRDAVEAYTSALRDHDAAAAQAALSAAQLAAVQNAVLSIAPKLAAGMIEIAKAMAAMDYVRAAQSLDGFGEIAGGAIERAISQVNALFGRIQVGASVARDAAKDYVDLAKAIKSAAQAPTASGAAEFRDELLARKEAADLALAQAQGNDAVVASLERERMMREAATQAVKDYVRAGSEAIGVTQEQYVAQQRAAAGAQYDAVKLAETYRDTQREILEISKDISRDVSETIYDGLTDPDGATKVVDWFKSLFKRIAVQALSANVILPITTAVVSSAPGLFGLGGSTAGGQASTSGSITDLLGLGKMIGGTGSTDFLGIGGFLNSPIIPSQTVGASMATTNGMLSGAGATGSGVMTSAGLGGLTYGGALGAAGAGFGISQMLAGMAPGNKLVSAGGGAVGGAITGLLITGGNPIGAIVGGVAGLIGGMMNDKPSNMEGVNTIVDLSSNSAGVDQGQTGKKYSAENWAAARAASDAVRDAAQAAFGKYADLSAAGVSFGVGSRDGSRSYILQNGQIQQEFRAASDEAGMKSLIGQSIAAIGRQYAEKLPIEMQKALQKIDFSKDIDEALRLLDFASSYQDTVKALRDGYGLEDQARKAARDSIEQQIDALDQFRKDAAFLDLTDAGAAVREFALTLVGLKESKAAVSETEAALSALDESFKVFRENLGTLGLTLDEVNAGYTASLNKLRDDFNAALDRSINEGMGLGILNQASDLLAAQSQRIKDAAALGADMGRVFRLNALEMASLYKDLGETQIAALNGMIALADDLSLSVSAALARITTGADALIASAQDARTEAIRLGQDWAKLAASLRADIAGLRIGSASTLSPQALLAETESQFRALFGQALAGNADAAGNLSGAANTYLEAAKGYYASSEAYQGIFAGVTSMLEQVAVGADTRATGYAALAATMEQQISILEQIRDVIARSQDISVLADTLQGYVTEGAITEATKGGIDAAIASLRPMVAGNEAAIQTLTNIASAVQDGTLTASEVNGLRGAITAMGSIDISAQISTFEAALRETGAAIAGLNIFLDDAAGAVPVAIITAFQDGLSAADLAARMGGLMSTTVDAAKTAILGGLTGSALDAAIIAPITDLMRNWASAYTSRLDAVFSGADFAVGFDRSTGRVIAAYQAAAGSAAAGITSAVAAVSFDPLTRSVAAAQQLVGGRFAAVIGGITFSGVDGTLITQAVYGENGVITKVAAALEGSATSIAGALSSTIAAADFGLVGARITGAVDILAGGASTVVVAAADLSDSALRLVAAGGAQIDLVAAKLSAGAAEIKALDASTINLIVGAWNSQSIDIAAIDASAVNIAIGEIQSSIDGITVLASGGSAVTGTLGAISGVIINLVAASGSVIALAAGEIAGAIIAIGATDRSSVTLAAAGYNDAIAAMFVSGSSKIALAGAGLRDASIAISGLATKAVTDRGIWLKDRVWSIGQAAEGTTRAYGLAVKAGAAEIAAMSADAVVSAAAWLGGRTAAIGGHAADRTMAYGAALRDGAVLIAGLSADSVVSAGDWLKDRTWSAGNHAATKVRAFGEAAKVAAIDIAGLSSSEVTDIGTWTAGRVKAVSDHAVEKTAAYGAALRNSAINIANLATGDLESMSSWLKDRVWSIGEHSAAKIFASGGIIRAGAVAIAGLSTENLSVAAAGLTAKVSASIESARALLTASTGSITAAGPEIATALASDYAVALKSVIGSSLGDTLNAAVAPVFSTSGAKTFADRLASAFDEVFGAPASSGVSASVTALIASNSSMVGALSTLRDQVIALTAQMAADRQSSAVAAAQTAYNAQVSAVGASATAQAQASLAPTIAGAGSSAYQRSYEASFDASGSMISAISHSTNEIARSQERVNGVAAKLTALGTQVTGIIGGDLPSIRINVRDNPASLSPDDLWYIRLQMDGDGTQRVIKSYNGADYTPIIEGYLSNLWRTMTGLSDEYKATLKDINWSPAASGMGDLAMAIERISRPFDGPQFATGGAFYGNGIYDRPTAFNMGVMGENGPEAVMPLANVGGRLGVRVAGGANDNGDAKAVVAELREQNRILRQLLAETAKGDEKTRDALVQRLDTANEISAKSASDAKRARSK